MGFLWKYAFLAIGCGVQKSQRITLCTGIKFNSQIFLWKRNDNLCWRSLNLDSCVKKSFHGFHSGGSSWTCGGSLLPGTLFSKRSAHWFTPVLPVTLGHWPWPRVISILSNGLDSNIQKIPFKNSTGSFASYSQDQLTKWKWHEVGVVDLGTSENWGGFHVHFFRRRVYMTLVYNSLFDTVELHMDVYTYNFMCVQICTMQIVPTQLWYRGKKSLAD